MGERHKHYGLSMLAGAAGLVLAGAITGGIVLLSGTFDTSATKQHLLVTHRLLDAGLQFSVRESAEDLRAPFLDDPRLQQLGLACYAEHCAQCHGAPGVPPGTAARGMLPVPGNLAQTAREWPPEWLYHVTRKGVRMTGMPAWEYRLSDASLWATVAFLRQLPTISADEYRVRASEAAATSCTPRRDVPVAGEGRGDVLLRQYACDACHIIDGVVGPRSFAGPPLRDWARRSYIAGVLPNTPANLERWIRDPQAINPGTLMPNLGVPPAHAREMARFLFAQGRSVTRTMALQAGRLCAVTRWCGSERKPDDEPHAGDVEQGRSELARWECGVCHVIPGVEGARGHVGPPLEAFARRVYVAGRFPNTPEVLARWIQDPPAMKPGTAMPALGVTEAQARDIAAYLHGLE